jgi:hypothetical protein
MYESLHYRVPRSSSPPTRPAMCDSPDPHTVGLVDKALWENRYTNQEAIEAELRGPKGRGWLMRWLPARAHDAIASAPVTKDQLGIDVSAAARHHCNGMGAATHAFGE